MFPRRQRRWGITPFGRWLLGGGGVLICLGLFGAPEVVGETIAGIVGLGRV